LSDPTPRQVRLQLLPLKEYVRIDAHDPIRFYGLPVIGRMYRQRMALCLGELSGGERVLEVGFGSGASFLNLQRLYRKIYGLELTRDVAPMAGFCKRHGIPAHLKNGDLLALPYADKSFDAVLLISVLEHLQPDGLRRAFAEVRRVLRPGGQAVYGVPVERRLMEWMYRLLGTDISEEHFSTQDDVYSAACGALDAVRVHRMQGPLGLFGQVYEVGHFVK
jgi:ubiquinone/menaquinone biosynthesis C-methylase UbiE